MNSVLSLPAEPLGGERPSSFPLNDSTFCGATSWFRNHFYHLIYIVCLIFGQSIFIHKTAGVSWWLSFGSMLDIVILLKRDPPSLTPNLKPLADWNRLDLRIASIWLQAFVLNPDQFPNYINLSSHFSIMGYFV